MAIHITTPQHDKRFTSPAVAWEWLRKQRPRGAARILGGVQFYRVWLQTASVGQHLSIETKHGATRLEVTE